MPQQTFEVTGPNGRVFEITGDRMPTEAELTDIFAKLPPKHAAKPAVEIPEGGPVYRAAAGVGRGVLGMAESAATLTVPSENPIERGLMQGAGAPPGTFEAIKAIGSSHLDQGRQAIDAAKRGDYVEAGLRGVATAVPVLGPVVAGLADRAVAGDIAGALGEVSTLAIPLKLPKGISAATKARLPVRVADTLARGAERRIVNVMTPKGSSRAVRDMGVSAEKMAPKVLEEPTMKGLSRDALKDRVEARLAVSEKTLDEVEAKRPKGPGDLVDPSPIRAALQERLNELHAPSAVGPEAHGAVEKMGLNPLPERAPSSAGRFDELPVAYKQELRRIQAELEYLEHTPGGKISTEGEVAREGGYGSGRGARVKSAATSKTDYRQAEAGAEVYHEVLAGKTGTARRAMEKSLRRYILGTQKSTPIVDRALKVADKRLRSPDEVSRPMLPPEAGFAEADVAGPLGQNVLPSPNRIEAAVLQQVLKEIDDLGPAVSYDALRKIRQAWDKEAEYLKTNIMDPDANLKKARRAGARKATGTLRDAMAIVEPETAASNADYHIWRSVDDVMEAAENANRVRPTVGRQIIARGAGALVGGGIAGGVVGILAGGFLGGVVDSMISQGLTTKIATARMMTRLSKALRKGDESAALMEMRKLAAVAGKRRELNTALYAGRPQESK